MNKIDFTFEDLTFSLKCTDEDSEEITRLANTFLSRARKSRVQFPSLSAKNAIFVTALTIMSEQTANHPKPEADTNMKTSYKIQTPTSDTENQHQNALAERLSLILQKVRNITNAVRADLLRKPQ
jgi:cell division protein ZapA (FtsZ GTPase activity inhibitor)